MFTREVRGRARAGLSRSEHHHGAVFLIGAPRRDAFPVRVSGPDEVPPVRADRFRELLLIRRHLGCEREEPPGVGEEVREFKTI